MLSGAGEIPLEDESVDFLMSVNALMSLATGEDDWGNEASVEGGWMFADR